MLPGMPLIYSGQEYDLDKRLQFFEKDSIPKERGDYFKLLATLGALKNNNTALHGGKEKASLIKIDVNHPAIMSFGREKEAEQLVFIGNFSSKIAKTTYPYSGTFTNAVSGEEVIVNSNNEFALEPWEFYILKPKNTLIFDTRIVPDVAHE